MRIIKLLLLSLLSLAFFSASVIAQQVPKHPENNSKSTRMSKRMVKKASPLRAAKINSLRIKLQPSEKTNITKSTKGLVQQHFASKIKQSLSVRPVVKIISKRGGIIKAEAEIVFLARNTYTATISKLVYEIKGGKTIFKQKINNYMPTVKSLRRPKAIDPKTLKLKKTLLASLKAPIPQGWGPKALANTPCPEFPTAVQYTNDVYNTFKTAFGSAQKLIGSQSKKSTIMNILKKGTRLLAWNNIGHGNPSLIVQWDGERMSDTDFNTTTAFKGIYNSVILLNSCNVCKSPYALKKAIKNHRPRAYIGGKISLPVGRSEKVDADFWKYTLLQKKTMAWALNKASANHNLAGAFCLDGFSGKFVEVATAKISEDCISFNPNNIRAKKVSGRWKVVEGASHWMLDFNKKEAAAKQAVKIIKHYGWKKQCFVGRPNAPMTYWRK